MKFKQLKEAPKETDKYYGKPDPFISSGLGMFQLGGNCTDYCWCRYRQAQEDMNGSRGLPTSAAYRWYKDAVAKGLSTGSVAKLGAVAVFGKPNDKIGHVAFVEAIDGINITYSSSGWKKNPKKRYLWKTKKLKQAQAWGVNYPFLCYIYNEEFENDKSFKIGKEYKVLKSKILRTGAKVSSNNKIKVKECNDEIKKLLTSTKPNDIAKLKVGKKVVFSKYKSDSKGNTWGLLVGNNINSWVCVCDSTGNQVK